MATFIGIPRDTEEISAVILTIAASSQPQASAPMRSVRHWLMYISSVYISPFSVLNFGMTGRTPAMLSGSLWQEAQDFPSVPSASAQASRAASTPSMPGLSKSSRSMLRVSSSRKCQPEYCSLSPSI